MQYRPFGNIGIQVSALGFGAMQIGDPQFTGKETEYLLHGVLDCGITLLDTARSYGHSEERIGKYLSSRRQEFVLSTKVGYGIEGHEDWTYDCVIAGIDAALQRLQTDYIDIVHLHSCSQYILQTHGVVDALLEGIEQGKVRVAAYSGENDDLGYAIRPDNLGGIQTSVNIFDQHSLMKYIPSAKERGMGVIAKRSVANAPWRFDTRPTGHYAEEYWLRMQEMADDLSFIDDWQETALRFTAYAPGVDSCIIGTTNLMHLQANIRHLEKGALPPDQITTIQTVYKRCNSAWVSQL